MIKRACEAAASDLAATVGGGDGDCDWTTVEVSAVVSMVTTRLGQRTGAFVYGLAGSSDGSSAADRAEEAASDALMRALLAGVDRALDEQSAMVAVPPLADARYEDVVRLCYADSALADLWKLVQCSPVSDGSRDSDAALGMLLRYARDGSWRSLVPGGAHSRGD